MVLPDHKNRRKTKNNQLRNLKFGFNFRCTDNSPHEYSFGFYKTRSKTLCRQDENGGDIDQLLPHSGKDYRTDTDDDYIDDPMENRSCLPLSCLSRKYCDIKCSNNQCVVVVIFSVYDGFV